MSSPVSDTGEGLHVAQHGSITDNNEDDSGKTLQGSSSANKQTRRLQLRNAGFRGTSIPMRRTSPTFSHSNSWSSNKAAMNSASDIENVSPISSRTSTPASPRRESGGILQEIGNSTLTPRVKKTRQRVSSKSFKTADRAESISPPLSHTGLRKPSVKSRPRVLHRRRSVSGEKTKYIEHLEVELAATQSQLSSSTSSMTNTNKEHSVKMRSLQAEIKQLQQDLLGWESKYDERVQEEITRHAMVESDLKARIRCLEHEAEETKFRNQDLEAHLELTSQNLEAVEVANVQLEKRLEVLGELLASTKVDLHAETPGRGRRHVRPKSMLPRFPTASSLMSSPERQTRTQPVSPLSTFTNGGDFLMGSPVHNATHVDLNDEQTDFTSEAESIFSEDSIAADSMTSAENFEAPSVFNPWHVPPRPVNHTKPARRMRRFGAGSLGPKPLILPATSNCEQFTPASAPPLEHSKTTPAFFPDRFWVDNDGHGSPVSNRRRASTISTGMSVHNETTPALLGIGQTSISEEGFINYQAEYLVDSRISMRRHSSFGTIEGRNLMEELNAARFDDMTEDTDQQSNVTALEDTTVIPQTMDVKIANDLSAFFDFDALSTSLNSTPKTISRRSSREAQRARSPSPTPSMSGTCYISTFSRLRAIFGELWRSPVAMARYLVQAAQARMQIPRPLLSVQWWLVGILIGPMAKHRLSRQGERGLLLVDEPVTPLPGNTSTIHLPESTPSQISTRSRMSTALLRRPRNSEATCFHHYSKHSPWLWIRFSITLAFAIGVAFRNGPGSLLEVTRCRCRRAKGDEEMFE